MNRKSTDWLYYTLVFGLVFAVSLILLTLLFETGGDKLSNPAAFVLAHLFAGRLTGTRWLMAAMLGVLFTCVAYTAHYRLTGGGRRIENGAFGNANYDSPVQRRKLYRFVRYRQADTPGFTLECNAHGCEVDTTLQTVMLVCPPGGGKTKSLLIPTLLYNAIVNENTAGNGASILSVDCKGEEYFATHEYMQKRGYRTPLLDFRCPQNSLQYNLLTAVNRYMDQALSSDDPAVQLEARAMAERQAKILSEAICVTTEFAPQGSDNPFFTETAKGLITAITLVVSEFGEPEERHIVSVFRLLIELNGLMQQPGQKDDRNQKSRLGTLLDLLPGDVRAKLYAGAATSADVRTSMNVFSSALSKLLAFMDAQMEQLICAQSPGLTAEEFIAQPTCLYLVLPDEDNSAHFFATLFMEQITTMLVHLASTKHGAQQQLPRRVLVLWDELGQSPRCKRLPNWIGAWRSRGIRLVMSLQAESQLEAIYGSNVTRIIREATQIRMYSHLGSGDTAQKLSKEMGNYTVATQSVTNGDRNGSTSQSTTGKPLLSHNEIGALPIGTWIVMASGHDPILARLRTFDQVRCWREVTPTPYDGETRPVQAVPYLTEQTLRERYVREEHPAPAARRKSAKTDASRRTAAPDPLAVLFGSSGQETSEEKKKTPFRNRKTVEPKRGE